MVCYCLHSNRQLPYTDAHYKTMFSGRSRPSRLNKSACFDDGSNSNRKKMSSHGEKFEEKKNMFASGKCRVSES